MSLNYVAGRSGRVVMTDDLLPSVPASKAALRELILPLLDETDEPMDDENLIDYGTDSVRMMALAARWRKVHGDIDFVMLAKIRPSTHGGRYSPARCSNGFDFTGKTVWVTGAGKGIGYATALAFADAGAKVTGFDLAFPQENYPFATQTLDVSDAAQVSDVCGRLLAVEERLDILVNAAAFCAWAPRTSFRRRTGSRRLRSTLAGRLTSFNRRWASSVVSRVGRLSPWRPAAHTPRIGMSAYGASKAALAQPSPSGWSWRAAACAVIWCRRGQRIPICSAPVDLRRCGQQRIRGFGEQFKLGIPLGKIARPQEIASTILFGLRCCQPYHPAGYRGGRRLHAGGVMIWKRHLSLDALNATSQNTLVAHLGIVYTRLGDDMLEAEMPVDARTHQPFGLLHGGASAALAGAGLDGRFSDDPRRAERGGNGLNATHHRAVAQGTVRGVCQPLHLGRSSQSWGDCGVRRAGTAVLYLPVEYDGAGVMLCGLLPSLTLSTGEGRCSTKLEH